ncbi:MAG: pyridoxamine 5'-phosphate oxidase family protein [Pseudomonadota bacterium]|nr:pyridoxamine 5'-phosphate oxidase family protein [Pseudomonadota bacterium]
MDVNALAVRALLSCRQAVLATQSGSIPGFPLTSVVPVSISPEGQIIVLMSDLAQHARNIYLDNRVSMMLHNDQEQNWQAATRLSVLGRMEALDLEPTALQSLRDAYYRAHPELADFDRAPDFQFWILQPLRFRLIAGYAQVRWLKQVQTFAFPLESEDIAQIEQRLPHRGKPIRLLHACQYGVQIAESGRVRFLSFRKPVGTLAGLLMSLTTGSFDDPRLNKP